MYEAKENNGNVIEAVDLVKRFGNFVANDRLTFSVQRGEIFGFLGANGAGKTTAIRILCGLSKPTSGQIRVAGYDVYTRTEKIKQRIGYMSQRFSLYEDLTVWENFRFFGGIYRMKSALIRERADQMLGRLGILELSDAVIASLPPGIRQKLAFSVAILHKPEIVFLDEPTGGVDPVTRRQFWEMIYEAAATGITVFVTTHYMDEAEYCNRVSIMVDGKIEALDTPEQLKKTYNAGSMNDVFLKLARRNEEQMKE
ncbi:MAG TPA: ABC transporter ATP-binding protein [Lentimicrobium sp.]|nr:ABC transporter ATP-binding protein [Lentimicrobium sp.]